MMRTLDDSIDVRQNLDSDPRAAGCFSLVA